MGYYQLIMKIKIELYVMIYLMKIQAKLLADNYMEEEQPSSHSPMVMHVIMKIFG